MCGRVLPSHTLTDVTTLNLVMYKVLIYLIYLYNRKGVLHVYIRVLAII